MVIKAIVFIILACAVIFLSYAIVSTMMFPSDKYTYVKAESLKIYAYDDNNITVKRKNNENDEYETINMNSAFFKVEFIERNEEAYVVCYKPVFKNKFQKMLLKDIAPSKYLIYVPEIIAMRGLNLMK